ncbi:hypothetical protein INQ41_10125 [Lysobacter ciconiae]|uniref:Uncharacterized protein n=1 Tax=Novilysobacter ciconiae TaxID=2781022 RepID=A0A7S6ZRR8_9GAMM|nr:hypothetical protein [Lysobacter ciconiae]QOW19007.1 hypothetical protein INQ41_10125 [Lysobacter ciconiae]
MEDMNGYAVFFFPQALAALGEVIKPFLREGAAGTHVVCRAIDTGGAMFKMDLDGQTTAGDPVALEMMIPGSMVRLIVSARIEESFGFGPRIAVSSLVPAAQAAGAVPVVAPTASGASADPEPTRGKAKSKSKGTSKTASESTPKANAGPKAKPASQVEPKAKSKPKPARKTAAKKP